MAEKEYKIEKPKLHNDRGCGYRSTRHNINGPNINELQINCSIDQRKPLDVQSIILTNMLLRSTAPHINKYS